MTKGEITNEYFDFKPSSKYAEKMSIGAKWRFKTRLDTKAISLLIVGFGCGWGASNYLKVQTMAQVSASDIVAENSPIMSYKQTNLKPNHKSGNKFLTKFDPANPQSTPLELPEEQAQKTGAMDHSEHPKLSDIEFDTSIAQAEDLDPDLIKKILSLPYHVLSDLDNKSRDSFEKNYFEKYFTNPWKDNDFQNQSDLYLKEMFKEAPYWIGTADVNLNSSGRTSTIFLLEFHNSWNDPEMTDAPPCYSFQFFMTGDTKSSSGIASCRVSFNKKTGLATTYNDMKYSGEFTKHAIAWNAELPDPHTNNSGFQLLAVPEYQWSSPFNISWERVASKEILDEKRTQLNALVYGNE